MLGDREVIFDSSPVLHIESVSYCTIGQINKDNFLEFLDKYPQMRRSMTDRIIKNPYDPERDYFVEICRKNIEFLKFTSLDVLTQLFYRSKQQFLDYGQKLFNIGDLCEDLFIVLSGTIDIQISDGYENTETLDVLGRGSVIGFNNILNKEMWYYAAINL